MSVQFKYELTEAQANMSDNLALQFKRDIDNCNNGSIETRKRYHKALEGRFAKFLARDFRLENIKNIGPKHIYAYVRFLQENGKSAGYIMTELSAIRFWHKRSKCKNHLPDNKDLNLEKRQIGKYNRGLLENEYKSLLDLHFSLHKKLNKGILQNSLRKKHIGWSLKGDADVFFCNKIGVIKTS